MTSLNSLGFAVALALGLASVSAQAEPVRSVAGEPAWPTKAAPAVTWRLAQVPAGSTTRIDLPALELARVAELQKRNARRDNIATQIGVGRDITDASVQAKLGRLRQEIGGDVGVDAQPQSARPPQRLEETQALGPFALHALVVDAGQPQPMGFGDGLFRRPAID